MSAGRTPDALAAYWWEHRDEASESAIVTTRTGNTATVYIRYADLEVDESCRITVRVGRGREKTVASIGNYRIAAMIAGAEIRRLVGGP